MIGQIIGNRYKITRELGSGGMAWVYMAEDIRDAHRLALKVLYPQLAADVTYIQRFIREAKLAMALSDKHIVKVLDYGADRDTHFLAMEYIQGKSLRELLDERGSFPLDEALDIAYQITQALQDAHSHGIVHRDIKPQNLMIMKDGLAKVLDFGVARAQDLPSLTRSGFVGSPYYMAPEQAMGELVDVRSDIYSLGIVTFEMLTGRLPFAAETPWSIVSQHISTPPPPLRQFRPEVPAEMEELINKALAKRSEDRFQNPEEIQAALRKVAEAADIELKVIPPTPTPTPTPPVSAEPPSTPEVEAEPEPVSTEEPAPSGDQASLLSELYDSGEEAMKAEDWQRALNLYSQIVQIDPDYRDASAKLAQAGREVNQMDLYQKALAAIETKQWKEAKSLLDKLLGSAPNYKDAPALLIRVEDELKKKEGEDTQAGGKLKKEEVTTEPKRGWLRWVIIGAALILLLLCAAFFLSGRGSNLVAMLNPIDTSTPTNTATPEPTSTATPSETTSATPEPTETETSSVTFTPSPTASPSRTPSQTNTFTPTSTDTRTATPTDTATSTKVATRVVVTPTETEISEFKYEALQIVGPVDEFASSGPESPPVLEWEPVDDLGEDEYYSVTIFRMWQGQPYYAGGDWTKDTEFTPDAGIVRETSDLGDRYEWWVNVVEYVGDRGDGGREGVPISPDSEHRVFYWH